MNARVMRGAAQSVVWGLQRNPLYLLSAACMAFGARLYLVNPDTYAGDVGVILLTLGVLQVYEWAVLGVLLVLKRFRRAPEDQGSLLLVAAVFWTGPLAATVELAAEEPRLGMLLGIAVAVFALLEMGHLQRHLKLRLSISGRVLASLCFVLLVVAPLRLRVIAEEGTDEIFLYSCWWILTALTLLVAGTLRERSTRFTPSEAGNFAHLHIELTFLVIVIAASATHLVGMNYAFVGHARFFYATPLLLVLTLITTNYLAQHHPTRHGLRWVVAGLPVIAFIGSTQGFDPEVPTNDLPAWLRNPMNSTLALAAVVWWLAAWRLKSMMLFHLGSLALVGAIWQISRLIAVDPLLNSVPPSDVLPTQPISQQNISLAFFGVIAYLLMVALARRSLVHVTLALITLQPAAAWAAFGRPDAPFIIASVGLWSVLIGLHLQSDQRRWGGVLITVYLLAALNWYIDFHADTAFMARLSSAALVAMLLVIGYRHPASYYRMMAAGLFAANVLFFSGRIIASGPYPLATLVAAGSFVLLTLGACVSWHKQTLLNMARRSALRVTTGEAETEAADNAST